MQGFELGVMGMSQEVVLLIGGISVFNCRWVSSNGKFNHSYDLSWNLTGRSIDTFEGDRDIIQVQ